MHHTKELYLVIVLLVTSVGVYLFLNTSNGNMPEQVACTEEALICPDGSTVGRVAPSCEFAPCAVGEVVVGAGVEELGINETKQVGGLSVTFHRVVGDYRCPSDAQCIQAGAIVADVTLVEGQREERLNISSDEVARTFGAHHISITGVQPPLLSGVPAEPDAYRVTFTVEVLSKEEAVDAFIRTHVTDLSPTPPVLGGTFYVTNITFGAPGNAVVEYEDGHIALVADVVYAVSPARKVKVASFVVRTDEEANTTSTEYEREPSLDLSGKELTSVSKDVFARTELVSLDLSDNTLTGALQAEVRNLSKLEWLDLSNNNFTGLPAEVGQLSELRYLDLSGNNLTGLPYELGNLKKLEVLDLTGNDYATADLDIIKQGLPKTVRIIGE